jgi:hypothetical protein
MATTWKMCWETKRLSFPVKLEQHIETGRFRVTYGREVHNDLTYEQAGRHLGLSIMHALACDRRLDPRLVDGE